MGWELLGGAHKSEHHCSVRRKVLQADNHIFKTLAFKLVFVHSEMKMFIGTIHRKASILKTKLKHVNN